MSKNCFSNKLVVSNQTNASIFPQSIIHHHLRSNYLRVTLVEEQGGQHCFISPRENLVSHLIHNAYATSVFSLMWQMSSITFLLVASSNIAATPWSCMCDCIQF